MKFDGPDAVRAAVKTHPLFAEWALAALIDRGVLTYTASGAVEGIEIGKKPAPGGKRTGKEWGQSWPRRDNMLAAAEEFGEKGAVVADFRRAMIDRGDIDHQWSVLHALWFLEKEKILRRVGKRYILDGAGAEKVTIERAKLAAEKVWAGLSEGAKADYRHAAEHTGDPQVISGKLCGLPSAAEWAKIELTDDLIDGLFDLAFPPVTPPGPDAVVVNEGGAS